MVLFNSTIITCFILRIRTYRQTSNYDKSRRKQKLKPCKQWSLFQVYSLHDWSVRVSWTKMGYFDSIFLITFFLKIALFLPYFFYFLNKSTYCLHSPFPPRWCRGNKFLKDAAWGEISSFPQPVGVILKDEVKSWDDRRCKNVEGHAFLQTMVFPNNQNNINLKNFPNCVELQIWKTLEKIRHIFSIETEV